MTGSKKYYKIPILTKMFNIRFYCQWRDDKFKTLGIKKEKKMSLSECISRLEAKRIRQERYKDGSIF